MRKHQVARGIDTHPRRLARNAARVRRAEQTTTVEASIQAARAGPVAAGRYRRPLVEAEDELAEEAGPDFVLAVLEFFDLEVGKLEGDPR